MGSAPRMSAASAPRHALSEFCSEVMVGLTQPGQKELPSKYLYDAVGSALFDVICMLPEYGLARAGMRMLERYSGEIVGRIARARGGCRTGKRKRPTDALAARGPGPAAGRELLPDRHLQ